MHASAPIFVPAASFGQLIWTCLRRAPALAATANLISTALARSKESEKLGIAICYGTKSGIFFAEAGIVSGNGGDDFIWMDVWQVCLGYSTPENPHAQPSSSLSG
jgi:hypothetical protein